MASGSRRVLSWLAVAGSVLSLTGCGGRETYQVSGRVQYKDGSPITGGTRLIRFEPTADTTAEVRTTASGMIEPDGTFEMFRRKPGDGMIPGKYAVTFTVMDKPLGGKSLIPHQYTTSDETPFEIVVDDDKTGLLYELDKL
jgi:hypothetical protein